MHQPGENPEFPETAPFFALFALFCQIYWGISDNFEQSRFFVRCSREKKRTFFFRTVCQDAGTSGHRAGGGPPGPRRPRPACRPGAGAIASPDFHFHRGEIKGNAPGRGPFFEWGPVFLSGGRGVEPDPTQTNRRGRPPNFFLSRKTSSPPCFQQTLVNHTTFCCAVVLL